MAKKRPARPPVEADAARQGEIRATWKVENIVVTVIHRNKRGISIQE